jgi:hypothetical protein
MKTSCLVLLLTARKMHAGFSFVDEPTRVANVKALSPAEFEA